MNKLQVLKLLQLGCAKPFTVPLELVAATMTAEEVGKQAFDEQCRLLGRAMAIGHALKDAPVLAEIHDNGLIGHAPAFSWHDLMVLDEVSNLRSSCGTIGEDQLARVEQVMAGEH